jgi:hypothetical protein
MRQGASRQEREFSFLSAGSGGLGRIPVKLLAWICAPFAWKVVRQHNGYSYFENAVTGRRRCRWDGNGWGRVDYSFMRSGDVSYGPFGRQVFD